MFGISTASHVDPISSISSSQIQPAQKTSSETNQENFRFAIREQDKLREMLIEAGVIDQYGRVSTKVVQDNTYLTISPESRDRIKALLHSQFTSNGRFPDRFPCKISMSLINICQDIHRILNQKEPGILYCGGSVLPVLGEDSVNAILEKILSPYFSSLQFPKGQSLITNLLKCKLHRRPNDLDIQVKPSSEKQEITYKKCKELADHQFKMIKKEFEKNPPKWTSDINKIYEFLKKEQKPLRLTPYLQEAFKDFDTINPTDKEQLLNTMLKVIAFAKAENFESESSKFFIRSIGNEKLSCDFVYRYYAETPIGKYSFHTLAVYIDELIANPNGYSSPRLICTKGNVVQSILDNNLGLITTIPKSSETDQISMEDVDFYNDPMSTVIFIAKLTEEFTCLEDIEKKLYLGFSQCANAKKQRCGDFAAHQIIRYTRSHWHEDPERLLALTYNFSCFFERVQPEQPEIISDMWKEIFRHFSLNQGLGDKVKSPLLNAISYALTKDNVPFSHVHACVSIGSEIAANFPTSDQITLTDHGNSHIFQVGSMPSPKPNSEIKRWTMVFSYDPHKALAKLDDISRRGFKDSELKIIDYFVSLLSQGDISHSLFLPYAHQLTEERIAIKSLALKLITQNEKSRFVGLFLLMSTQALKLEHEITADFIYTILQLDFYRMEFTTLIGNKLINQNMSNDSPPQIPHQLEVLKSLQAVYSNTPQKWNFVFTSSVMLTLQALLKKPSISIENLNKLITGLASIPIPEFKELALKIFKQIDWNYHIINVGTYPAYKKWAEEYQPIATASSQSLISLNESLLKIDLELGMKFTTWIASKNCILTKDGMMITISPVPHLNKLKQSNEKTRLILSYAETLRNYITRHALYNPEDRDMIRERYGTDLEEFLNFLSENNKEDLAIQLLECITRGKLIERTKKRTPEQYHSLLNLTEKMIIKQEQQIGSFRTIHFTFVEQYWRLLYDYDLKTVPTGTQLERLHKHMNSLFDSNEEHMTLTLYHSILWRQPELQSFIFRHLLAEKKFDLAIGMFEGLLKLENKIAFEKLGNPLFGNYRYFQWFLGCCQALAREDNSTPLDKSHSFIKKYLLKFTVESLPLSDQLGPLLLTLTEKAISSSKHQLAMNFLELCSKLNLFKRMNFPLASFVEKCFVTAEALSKTQTKDQVSHLFNLIPNSIEIAEGYLKRKEDILNRCQVQTINLQIVKNGHAISTSNPFDQLAPKAKKVEFEQEEFINNCFDIAEIFAKQRNLAMVEKTFNQLDKIKLSPSDQERKNSILELAKEAVFEEKQTEAPKEKNYSSNRWKKVKANTKHFKPSTLPLSATPMENHKVTTLPSANSTAIDPKMIILLTILVPSILYALNAVLNHYRDSFKKG